MTLNQLIIPITPFSMKAKKLLSRSATTALVLATQLLGPQAVRAQGAATAGLSQAAAQVRGAFQPVQTLMYAICAIMGIIGAINVYSKWANGEPDTRKAAASWFGALIFAGLVIVVLTSVFGG